MKVLWLSHLIPYPPKGGVLQRSHHLVCEVARYHEVDLLAFNQTALLKPLFETVAAGVAEAAAFFDGVVRRHHFVPLPGDTLRYGRQRLALRSLVGQPYNIRWLESAQFRRVLSQWVADTRYDLVHFDTLSLIPYRDVIARTSATVLDHHNIESSMLVRRSRNESSWPKKLYFLQEGLRLRGFERKYCPAFDLNVTCSDLDSSELLRLAPGSRVETVPNAVDTSYFTPGEAQEGEGPSLIFVGRLNWYPNAQAANFIAEELWPRLQATWPQLRFDLVGANPPQAPKSLAGRDPRFKVHGFVDDVRPMMTGATVYVCPITDGGGTKLKVLDAMAMGKALVAHPVACEGIAVVPEENVLFAQTPEDFVRQIGRLLGDRGLRQRLGAGARRMVETHYSKLAIGRQLAGLFDECVTDRDSATERLRRPAG
jgi:glycosyltransferase involved in cell wall biosynthesis